MAAHITCTNLYGFKLTEIKNVLDEESTLYAKIKQDKEIRYECNWQRGGFWTGINGRERFQINVTVWHSTMNKIQTSKVSYLRFGMTKSFKWEKQKT